MNQQSAQLGRSVELDDVKTDGQGAFFVSGLEAGHYILGGPGRSLGSTTYYVYHRGFDLKDDEKKEVNLGDNLGQSLLAGAVFDNGNPVANCMITLNPTFEWEYESISGHSDENGVYTIDGLQPGKYRAHVRRLSGDTGPNTFRIEEVVEVSGGTTKHDFEKGGHKLTARLMFDKNCTPEFRSSFNQAQLTTKDVQQAWKGPSKDRIDYQAQGQIKAGAISFSGLFKGEYQMMIQAGANSGRYSAITLPQSFKLDNTEADQDLGDIQVPATGRIKIGLTIADPSIKIQQLAAMVSPVGQIMMNQLSIDPAKAEQTVGPMTVGTVDVRLVGNGFRCEPPVATIEVNAGADAGPVNFTIIPTADVMVFVASGSMQAPPKMISGAKVTLNGGGVQRVLQSTTDKYDMNALLQAFTANKDAAVGPMFGFRDLPPGQYNVTIEAAGYKPFNQKVQAAKGAMRQVQGLLQAAK